MTELLIKKEAVPSKPEATFTEILLFYVSLLVLFVTAASYGGVLLLNTNQQKTKTRLVEEIKLKEESLRSELLNEIFLLDERLRKISILLNRHIFTSNLFKLLETDVHPQVRFMNFNLPTNTKKMELSGETASYTALSKQIAILERNPQIEKVEFGGLSFTPNSALNFRMNITFKSGILLIRP